MNRPSRADDIYWAECRERANRLLFFVTSPHINAVDSAFFGRLVYCSYPPYGPQSIKRDGTRGVWYKVIHRQVGADRRTVADAEMLRVAASHGFATGSGIHSNLLRIPIRHATITPSPSAMAVFPEQAASVIRDVAHFYDVDDNELGVTGAAGAIGERFLDLRDLDVVVPIRSETHAAHIVSHCMNSDAHRVPLSTNWARALARKHSSIRWRHASGLVVCPFFVYSCMLPPIVAVRPTGTRFVGRVTITDVTYGIFNTHCYSCEGIAPRLMICSTLARGEVRRGQQLMIDCPRYRVTLGAWAGEDVAVVNAPHLDFMHGRLEGL